MTVFRVLVLYLLNMNTLVALAQAENQGFLVWQVWAGSRLTDNNYNIFAITDPILTKKTKGITQITTTTTTTTTSRTMATKQQ